MLLVKLRQQVTVTIFGAQIYPETPIHMLRRGAEVTPVEQLQRGPNLGNIHAGLGVWEAQGATLGARAAQMPRITGQQFVNLRVALLG